jgi:galactose mutarotase-like enzyme
VVELNAGKATAVVDPHGGGRLETLRVGEVDLLLTPEDDAGATGHFGSFVMAPWAGRTRHGRFTFRGQDYQLPLNDREHALHGTVRDRPWAVEGAGTHKVLLSCDLGPHWPFAGWVEHLVRLHEDHLDLELSVHANDDAMPAACGWHPWWRRTLPDGETAELELHADAMHRRDDEGIAVPDLVRPPSPGPWDDCFTELSAPAKLRWSDTIEVTIDTDCPDLVVFDELDEAVCVEPQTGPPDALNHEPFVVEPDRPLRATTRWRWQ